MRAIDAYSQSIALVRHAVAAARDAASLSTANTTAAETRERGVMGR